MIISDSILEIILVSIVYTFAAILVTVILIIPVYILYRGARLFYNRVKNWVLMEPQRTDMSRRLGEAIDKTCQKIDELNTENSIFRESFDNINQILNDDDYRSNKLDRIRQVMENHFRQLGS